MNAVTDWKDDLIIQIVKMNEQEFDKENLKDFIQEFANKHRLAFSTVRSNYYKFKKELAHNENVSTAAYEIGDCIDVSVTGIASYGVFAVTCDEHKKSGLIHVSEIKDSYIPDLNRHFKIGDHINAKIIRIEQEKYSFSVKHIALPDYYEEGIENELSELESNSHTNHEIDEVVKYLNNIVGILSPEAKTKLNLMIKEHGIFKFSLTAASTVPEFNNDLGLILLNDIEKRIGDCL